MEDIPRGPPGVFTKIISALLISSVIIFLTGLAGLNSAIEKLNVGQYSTLKLYFLIKYSEFSSSGIKNLRLYLLLIFLFNSVINLIIPSILG